MIPSEILVLDRLPLTSTGKVDRRGLAALEVRERSDQAAYLPPATPREAEVAALLQSMLGRDRVGRQDDFFLAGGDSLKATRLHVALEERIGLRIPLERLFQEPTVAGLARCLDELEAGGSRIDRERSPLLVPLAMARQLRAAGQEVWPLLLIDPPVIPPGALPRFKRWRRLWRGRLKKWFVRPKVRQRMTDQLRHKREEGRITLDVSDGRAVKAALRTGFDFEIALLRHDPPVYDGPALLLGSRERLTGLKRVKGKLFLSFLTGEVRVLEVGAKHGEIHDVRNEVFARQLRQALEVIGGERGPRSAVRRGRKGSGLRTGIHSNET